MPQASDDARGVDYHKARAVRETYSARLAKLEFEERTGKAAEEDPSIHLRDADLALTMEDGHAEALRAEFPAQAHKVFMLTEMIGRNYNIPDPYGGPAHEYQRMYENLVEVIDAGLERIIELTRKNYELRTTNYE